uniref:Secreted salivary peptide n=1 Tax=Triatoma infestans TaxID=30076 RepID=A0A161MAP6_TRIIF
MWHTTWHPTRPIITDLGCIT